MFTAFIRSCGRGTGPGGRRLRKWVAGMAAGGPGGRQLPCPCAVRHAMAARTRVLSALAVTGLSALAVLCVSGPAARAQPAARSVSLAAKHGGGSAAERVPLIAVAVLAVDAYVGLHLMAGPHRRRWSAFHD